MTRKIDDIDYVECLTTRAYVRHYFRWKEKMLAQIDSIVDALNGHSIADVSNMFNLTPRDWALLVSLHYFTENEIAVFGLEQLATAVQL